MGNFDGPASSPETKLLAEIQGGLTSTRCGRAHTVYAVLLVVSPESPSRAAARSLKPDSTAA
jgi:hypothetical protein